LFLIFRKKTPGSHIIRFNWLNTSGFSAMGYIFINIRLSEEESEEILKHEQNHLDQNHFSDIIFIEIVKVFQWFNPFIHLFDRALRAIHEYQADEGCINRGISVVSYQQLLMNQVFKSKIFKITNSFSNPTLIKKRMIMMTKKRSGMLANLKLIMVLPVIAIVMIAFSSCGGKNKPASSTSEIAPPPPPQVSSDNKVEAGVPVPADAPPPPPPPPPFEVINGDTTWHNVDVMPLFPGGEKALMEFLSKNIKYPEAAKKVGIQGKVYISFTVSEKGIVGDAKILKTASPDLDAEALRVVNLLPTFEKPGLVKGKPVQVFYAIPINFTLK
jgi:TonB family protein